MGTKQLNNYDIKFYSKEEWNKITIPDKNKSKEFTFGDEMMYDYNICKNNEYAGLVSNISEEFLEKILYRPDFLPSYSCSCGERHTCMGCETIWDSTYLELFQTLSDLPYCVIILKNS